MVEQAAVPELKPFGYTYVVYRAGDFIGHILAVASLAPILIGVAYVTLLCSRRDLTTLTIFIGQLLNEGLNFVLKHIWREDRPTTFHIHAPKYGMPSNHSQFMGFWAVILTLWMWRCWSHPGRMWKVAGSACLHSAALLVMVSRVYLQYHTWPQVLVGYGVGAVAAVAWFACLRLVLRRHFPAIAASNFCRYWLIRDTTVCGDVMQLEYAAVQPSKKSV